MKLSDLINEREGIKKEVLNEDLGVMAINGVVSAGAINHYTGDQKLSSIIEAYDGLKLQQAIADLFAQNKDITDEQIVEQAANLKIPPEFFRQGIYDMVASLWKEGDWSAKKSTPVDQVEFQLGIAHEMEHTSNPIIAAKISKDHLADDPKYYSKLIAMENDPEERALKTDIEKKIYQANQVVAESKTILESDQKISFKEANEQVEKLNTLLTKKHPELAYRFGYIKELLKVVLSDGQHAIDVSIKALESEPDEQKTVTEGKDLIPEPVKSEKKPDQEYEVKAKAKEVLDSGKEVKVSTNVRMKQESGLYLVYIATNIAYKSVDFFVAYDWAKNASKSVDFLAEANGTIENESSGDGELTPLTDEQKDEIKREITEHGLPVRFLKNGHPVNISTGGLDPKGSNVMFQRVYWNFTKETAKKIAKWMNVKAVFDSEVENESEERDPGEKYRAFLKEHIGEFTDSPVDSIDAKFDIEAALYWYANDNHEGQDSDLYSLLSTSDFKPSSTHSGIEDAGETAEKMYDALMDEFKGK